MMKPGSFLRSTLFLPDSTSGQSPDYDFSVITACKDSSATLEACIQSVAAQENVRVEHLIFDAESKDGSYEILQRLSRPELVVNVEKDGGVYEAWNKALKRVRGRWIIFLGSDDELASSTVMYEILQGMSRFPECRLFYGQVRKETLSGELISFNGEPFANYANKFDPPTRAFPPHPATFFHKSLFDDFPRFDESYKICADSLHVGRIIATETPQFLDFVVTKFRVGGISNSRRHALRKWNEKLRISRTLKYRIPLFLVFRSFAASVLNKLRA